MPEALFERVMIAAHRNKKTKTISEYIVMILKREVPDNLIPRGGAGRGGGLSRLRIGPRR